MYLGFLKTLPKIFCLAFSTSGFGTAVALSCMVPTCLIFIPKVIVHVLTTVHDRIGRESSSGIKEFFNIPFLAPKARYLSGSLV